MAEAGGEGFVDPLTARSPQLSPPSGVTPLKNEQSFTIDERPLISHHALARVEAALWQLLARLGTRPHPSLVLPLLHLVARYGDTREAAGAAREAASLAAQALPIIPAAEAVSERLEGLSGDDLRLASAREAARELAAMGLKQCSRCATVKPLAAFYRDGSKKRDGRRAACKACGRADQAGRRAELAFVRQRARSGLTVRHRRDP